MTPHRDVLFLEASDLPNHILYKSVRVLPKAAYSMIY